MPGVLAHSKLRTRNPEQAHSAHAAAQEAHFIRRAKQRFGLRVSPDRYREFVRRVVEVDGDVRFLSRDVAMPTRTHWGVRFGGHLMRVVFDEVTERLCTCVPIHDHSSRLVDRDWQAKQRRLASKKRRRRDRSSALASQLDPDPCNS